MPLNKFPFFLARHVSFQLIRGLQCLTVLYRNRSSFIVLLHFLYMLSYEIHILLSSLQHGPAHEDYIDYYNTDEYQTVSYFREGSMKNPLHRSH